MTTLAKKTVSGVFWTTGTTMVGQGLYFVTSAILSRILLPEEFGRMGMVLVFAGFLTLFNQMGFGLALIQKEEVGEADYSTVFWLNCAIGLVLMGLFLAAAPLLSMFYHEPQVADLCRVMALQYPLGALLLVQYNIMRRTMQFRLLAGITFAGQVAGATCAIVMAMHGYGVWSLVGRLLADTGVRLCLTWILVPWRPMFVFCRASLAAMRNFSLNMLGFRIFNYWARRTDMLLAGKFIGAAPLGVYTRAIPTFLDPLCTTPNILSQVMFPALSRLAGEPERLGAAYLRALGIVALGLLPTTLGLAAVGDDFIRGVYGPNWDGAIPVVRVLALICLLQALVACGAWGLQAIGRADLLLRLQVASGVLQMGGLALGAASGSIYTMALGYALGALVGFVPVMLAGNRALQVPMRRWAEVLAGPAVCALLMGAGVWGLGIWLPAAWGAWPRLLTRVAAGIVLYGALVAGLRLAAWKDLWSNLRQYGWKGIFGAV